MQLTLIAETKRNLLNGIDASVGAVIRRDVPRRQPVNYLSRVRHFAGGLLLMLLAACGGDAGRAMSRGAVAQQQLDAGDLGAARQSITDALAERDDLPSLQLLRGRIEVRSERYSPAFDAYSAALALESTNMEALQGVAQLGLRTGNLRESEEAAGRILALEPDQPEALSVKGLLALVRRRPDETIADADRILARSPGNEGGVILKARALYMRGETGQALALLEKAEPLAGKTEGLAQTRLELMREAGDAVGMLAQFEELRRLRPDDFDLRIDEANLRYKTGDAAGARTLLRDAVLEPKRNDAQAARVVALWREYDHDPLTAADQEWLRRRASAAVRLGVARYYLDTDRAASSLELVAGDASLPARSLEARAAISGGDAAAGAAAAEQILASDQTQCDALIARSTALLGRRRATAAVVAAQSAATECPQNAAAWLELARANDAHGNLDGAKRAFADAVLRNPQDASLSAEFGSWLEHRGAQRQALGEARRLTRKAPALVSAWTTYLAACERYSGAACSDDARSGLARARRLLGIDRPSGELAPNGLLGRLPPR